MTSTTEAATPSKSSGRLERLAHFNKQLSQARNRDVLLQVALTGLLNLLQGEIVELNLIEQSSGRILAHRVSAPEVAAYFQSHPQPHYNLGQGLTGWLVEHRRLLHIQDLQEPQEDLPSPTFADLPFRSYLGAPLMVGEQVFGTLEIAHREADLYQPTDVLLFGLLALQVGVALRTCRLEEENSQRRRSLELLEQLRQARRELARAAEVNPAFLAQVADQLEVDLLAVFRRQGDPSKLTLQNPVHGEHAAALSSLALDIGPTSPLGSVLRTNAYWLTNNLHDDPAFVELGLALDPDSFPLQHLLFAPLGPPSELLGMLVVGRSREHPPFEESEAEILKALAAEYESWILPEEPPAPEGVDDRPAVKAVPAREPETVLQRTDTLLQLATQISTSLDLERVLAQSLAVLVDITPAERGIMLLYDADLNRFFLRASFGEGPLVPPGGIALEHGSGQGLGGWALDNRLAFVVPDLAVEERWIPFDDDAHHYKSAAVAPLIANNESLGAAILLSRQPEAFGEDELRALTTAAGQVAVAIKNAELYLLIREQAERMGVMLRSQQVESSTSRAILESIADGVVVTDADHRVVLFNAAAERILGLAADSILNQPVFDFIGLYGPEGQRWTQAIRSWKQRPPASLPTAEISERVVLEDERVLLIHPAPVVLGDEFLGTVSIFRDITREVEVDRLKSEFVATVSHELRTPMTSIKGFVDLLLMGATGDLNSEQQRFLNIVKNNTERLEILVNDLLDISRIEAGKVTLSFQPLDVRELLREAEAFVERQRSETGKQIQLAVEAPADLPSLWGDPERVRQILINLVENAFNYTPEGGEIILRAQQSADQVEIEVQDNGIGISLGEQSRIFERFYRGEQALIMGVAGTGLGLAIVLNLVEMHGGRIWVNSDGIPGRGTTFTLGLPIAKKPELATASQEAE
ncbi:MAG: GAF domain-containing protein [Anaerolineales bacterium]